LRQAIQPLLRINMIHADQSPQLDIELMRCSTTNPRRSHLLHSPPSRHLATRLLLETRHQLLSLRLTCSARELGRRPSTNSADGCSHARARSAAQSLYPHLPSAAREPVKQSTPTLADALWPGPKPPPNWHRESISLVQSNIRQGRSDIEIAKRYGVTKQAIEQIRKLGR